MSDHEEEPPTKQRKSKSFIEKVRQDKEKKLTQGTAIDVPSSTPGRAKMSIAEYRAARGLPPPAGRPVVRQNSSGGASSSLFINKKKPVAPVSIL